MVDLFEALDEGVVLVDSAGGVVFVNCVALKWKTLLDSSGELASVRAHAMVAWLIEGVLVDGVEILLDDMRGPNGEPVYAAARRFGTDGHIVLVFRLAPSSSPLLEPERRSAGAFRDSQPVRSLEPAGVARLSAIVSGALGRIAPVARSRGVRVHASLAPIESRLVDGDAFWLACALRDLLGQLIDGLPAGATLELTGHAGGDPVLVVRANAPNGFTRLRVLSVERDLNLVAGLLARDGGSLAVRCWPDRRLALLRLSGFVQPGGAAQPRKTRQSQDRPSMARSIGLAESASRTAAQLIERVRRTSACGGTRQSGIG